MSRMTMLTQRTIGSFRVLGRVVDRAAPAAELGGGVFVAVALIT